MYNLRELYRDGLSTPSDDERRLARILREKGQDEIAGFGGDEAVF
jgi:hypothetical protein